jgi:hypothetical protein
MKSSRPSHKSCRKRARTGKSAQSIEMSNSQFLRGSSITRKECAELNSGSIANKSTKCCPSKSMSETAWLGSMMAAGAFLGFLYAEWTLP